VVVAGGRPVVVELGRAAHLGHHDDRGRGEQAGLLQALHQQREVAEQHAGGRALMAMNVCVSQS
jgi:hypothetical protein